MFSVPLSMAVAFVVEKVLPILSLLMFTVPSRAACVEALKASRMALAPPPMVRVLPAATTKSLPASPCRERVLPVAAACKVREVLLLSSNWAMVCTGTLPAMEVPPLLKIRMSVAAGVVRAGVQLLAFCQSAVPVEAFHV